MTFWEVHELMLPTTSIINTSTNGTPQSSQNDHPKIDGSCILSVDVALLDLKAVELFAMFLNFILVAGEIHFSSIRSE